MKKKDCFKTSYLRIGAWLTALLILFPLNLVAEQEDKASRVDKIVKVKDGLVSVYATNEETMEILGNSDLVEVIKKIEAETGVKINLRKDFIGEKLNASFKDETMESALRQLLRGHYYVLSYEQDPESKDKKVLKEVEVKDNVIGKIPLKGKLNTIEIPYGKEEGEIGVFHGGEGHSSGPSCFAVDANGEIYIPDVLNKRMLRYTAKGESLPTIPFQTGAGDIVVDKQGLIYVYVPGHKKLYQYNMQGTIIKEIEVETSHLDSDMGSIYYANDNIYLTGCNHTKKCGKFPVAKISSNGVLLKASREETKKPLEYDVFQSGKKYKGRKRLPGFNAEVEIIYDENGIASRVLSDPFDGMLTRELLGEDKDGNFYFHTRTVKNVDRLYNIDKYGADGEYIGTAQIPGGKPFWGVSKGGFLMSESGNIYEFIPELEKLKLYVFIPEGQ